MALDERQIKFIDAFLETSAPESSAILAGYKQTEARQVAFDFLSNDEILEALEKRKQQLKKVAEVQKLDLDGLLRGMYYQYGKANRLNKTKEATDILCAIAKMCGVDPEKAKANPTQIVINNLDEDKI